MCPVTLGLKWSIVLGTELVGPEQTQTDVLLPPEANTQMNNVSLSVIFLSNQYDVKHQQRTPTGMLKLVIQALSMAKQANSNIHRKHD